MTPIELKEQEDRKYHFRPFSLQFLRAEEWDGALSDARWLWPWVRPHRRILAVALVLFGLATLIAVAVPRLVAKIVDDVLIARTYSFHLWIGLLAGVMLLKVIADLSYKWLVTKTGQGITRWLRSDVFFELGEFPLVFFDTNSSGRLISRCVNDVSNLSSFFTASFFTVISDVALILGAVVFLFTLSWKAAVLVLLTLLPMAVFMLNVSQAQMRWGRVARNILSRMSSHTADTMNNLAVLHSQPYADKWARRHEKLQRQYSAVIVRNILTWGSFSSLHVLVMGATYAAVIALGVYQLTHGETTIGKLIASFTYVGLVFGPFFEISEKLNVMVTALGSVKRLRIIVPRPVTRNGEPPVHDAAPPRGPLRFEGITFSYRPDSELFRNFSLELPEGEVTALVGRTGSGKTSLAHLLLGLYPIKVGRITWGDEDLATFPADRRARWMGHVSQDLFVFTDTLRENLRLWRETVTDDEIWARLRLVGLAEKIRGFPGGLDHVVRPETLPLSQGEKQLLLLCRALLQDPRLLVFDEATASLDQLTEEEWLGHVATLFKHRTTLFIAHRLEALRLATNVVVLENGRVKKAFRKEAGVPVRFEDVH